MLDYTHLKALSSRANVLERLPDVSLISLRKSSPIHSPHISQQSVGRVAGSGSSTASEDRRDARGTSMPVSLPSGSEGAGGHLLR